MLPAPPVFRVCPHCASHFAQKSYASRNTFGARFWTDGKMDAPMYPESPDIVKCPHCNGVLWVSKAAKAIGAQLDKRAIPHCEFVSESDLEALLENSEALSAVEIRQIRWKLWHLSNDLYRSRTKRIAPEYSKSQRENMASLFGTLSEEDGSECIAKAEIARELGWFTEADALLSREFDTKLSSAAETLRTLVKKRSPALALLS